MTATLTSQQALKALQQKWIDAWPRARRLESVRSASPADLVSY